MTDRRIDQRLRTAGLPPLTRAAWVEVDVDAIRSNSAGLASFAAPAGIAAVVKADGYGHGLEISARYAVAGGASWLCVANAGEARRLRRDGYHGRIFVLYPVPREGIGTMASLGVDLSVGSIEDLERIEEEADRTGSMCNVHIEIDTGMTRGGCPPEGVLELARAARTANRVVHAGTWTHLAAPEDDTSTMRQIERFDEALHALREEGSDPGITHVSASGGILAVDNQLRSLVRPGLALYGLHPDAGGPLPEGVGPALSVRAHPVRIAGVPSGTRVGYAGTWEATRDSLIATLPIGYADGWARTSSPGTFALIAGRRAPLVGRVSSDALTVDVTDLPDVGLDSEFTLLGNSGAETITADEVARVRGTISWEVLQQLGARLARVYMSNDSAVAFRDESSVRVDHSELARIPCYL